MGTEITLEDGRLIMSEIASTIDAFNGVSYAKMDENSGIQLDTEKVSKKVES